MILSFGAWLHKSGMHPPGEFQWHLLFCVKYGPLGVLQWARQGPANHPNTGRDVVAGLNGRIYVTGGFENTMDFGGNTYAASAGQDLFLVKYDGFGNELWALPGNGAGADEGQELTLDPMGNIGIAGTSENGLSFAGTSYAGASQGVFMSLLDPNATLLWSTFAAGTVEGQMGLSTDDCGFIYLAGTFTDSLRPDPLPTSVWYTNGPTDQNAFLMKFATTVPSGGFVWLKHLYGPETQTAHELYTDPSGRCYFTGSFEGASFFDVYTTDTAANREEAYVMKFDEVGDYEFHQRTQTAPGGVTQGMGLALDPFKQIYITGTFRDSVVAGNDTLYGVANGEEEVFLAKFWHADCDVPAGNYAFEFLICDGETLRIGIEAPNGTYSWSTGDTTPVITLSAPGTYVQEMEICGIRYTTTFNILPGGIASVDLGPDTTVCEPASVLLDAGTGGLRYLWNTGDTTASITVTEPGYYEVTCWSACDSATDGINVFVTPLPDPQLAGTMLICGSETTVLQANDDPDFSYLWSSGDRTSSLTVHGPGMFWVEVSNACGTDGTLST